MYELFKLPSCLQYALRGFEAGKLEIRRLGERVHSGHDPGLILCVCSDYFVVCCAWVLSHPFSALQDLSLK